MEWNQQTNPAAGPQAHDFWAFPGSLPGRPGGGTDHIDLHGPFPFRFGPGVDGVAFGPHGPWDPRGRRGSFSRDECSSDEESQASGATPGLDAKVPPVSGGEGGANMEGVVDSGEKEGSPDAASDAAEPEKAGDKQGEKPAGGARGCRHGRHGRHGPRGPHGHHGPPGPHGPPHHGHPGPGGPHGGPRGGPFGGPFGGLFGGHFGGPFHGPPFGGRGRGGRGCGRRGGFGFGSHEMHTAFGRGAEPQQAFQQALAAAAMAAHQHVGRYIQSLSGAPRGDGPSAAMGENDTGAPDNTDGDDSNNNNGGGDDLEYFTPPVDIFETEAGPSGSWVVHVAVPGAKKEDVGIHWQAERGVLAISGVVYRPGDEAFQRGLVSSERKMGLFKREVRLPPPSSAPTGKEDVDTKGITARLEDGVLSITVPRVEKEWTEVHKVDII
ncbi:hypothetical protein RB597_008636 [Gaeumannomyces tritici]